MRKWQVGGEGPSQGMGVSREIDSTGVYPPHHSTYKTLPFQMEANMISIENGVVIAPQLEVAGVEGLD